MKVMKQRKSKQRTLLATTECTWVQEVDTYTLRGHWLPEFTPLIWTHAHPLGNCTWWYLFPPLGTVLGLPRYYVCLHWDTSTHALTNVPWELNTDIGTETEQLHIEGGTWFEEQLTLILDPLGWEPLLHTVWTTALPTLLSSAMASSSPCSSSSL